MYMSGDEADAALSRLGEGATVRTRSATYRYQSEPVPTKEQLTEQLRDAVRKF